MKYDYSLRHPLFYICNNDSIDTSNRYSVSLPLDWYEIASDPEWVNQYPINGEIERQGWKVHISSDFKSSHEVLNIVAGLCHDENVAFKHLSTEDKFVLRNDKLIDRGYSGKFITCYPHEYQLENFLDKLESNLSGFNGPYILSDKRWKEAPIFLRYGVFREGNIDEPYADLKIDELLVEGKVIRDSREPKFTIVEGLKNPKFIEEWLHSRNIESGSELPFKIEKVVGNRYNTLGLCEKYNIPSIPYIRPFIPNENTDETTINNMFKKILNQYSNKKEISIIISGLRGNGICKENKINVFERTACGVSYVLGYDRTYNPYYSSPQLANCFNCPMKETCYDKQETFLPTNDDLELINFLGYNAEIVKRNIDKSNYICTVKPDNRKECISCCTSCFKLQRDSIKIEKFKDICLGDIGLLRLLTNKLVFCEDIIDNGANDIARPKNNILSNENIYILNSWYSYSKNINVCYKCSYCIVPHYQNQNKEYGEIPVEIAKKLYKKLLK